MNLTNSAQQRHRILCIFWFLSRVKGGHGLGCPVVSDHYFDRVIEKNGDEAAAYQTKNSRVLAPHSGHIRVFKFVTQTMRHTHCIIHTNRGLSGQDSFRTIALVL
jgi:hypothetical protein